MAKVKPAAGQESVWDYPRPPKLEKTGKLLEVYCAGILLARTRNGFRVLETSHPPVYYFPPEDVQMKYLVQSNRNTNCEYKGIGKYFHLKVNDTLIENAVWYYDHPTLLFGRIKNYLAFYPHLMNSCKVEGEQAQAQPGGFYGGWITSDITGPFKGGPGTWGW